MYLFLNNSCLVCVLELNRQVDIMEDFFGGAEICPQCSATFHGDMLRDHIILEHCQEEEIEHNYKVVLAEHSLKSLINTEEEVKADRQLRSRKVEGVVGSKKSKKRKSDDSPNHSLLIKMNETITDEDVFSPEPKRRSTTSKASINDQKYCKTSSTKMNKTF